MSKFKQYANRSVFTEVFTARDRQSFDLAYGIGLKDDVPQQVKARQGDARQWIMGCMGIFADKVHLSVGQAKQLFESGDFRGLKGIYLRQLPILRAELSKMLGDTVPRDKLEERIKEIVKLSEMDGADLVNAIRAEWVWALSLTHPSREYHKVSGKMQTKQGESTAKVGDKPKAAAPAVTSKRPKAAKAA